MLPAMFTRRSVPGMLERENVNLTVENGVLTIEADQRSETENQGEGYHVRERRVGKVSRSFRLPKDVDADKIGAELKNGVLRLTIPKAESAKPKKIQVKMEGE